MCSPSAPPPAPDPVATAAAQAAANKETSIASQELSMVNQDTPYGGLVYTQHGESEAGTPQYTATQTLAPSQQKMLDLTNQAGIQYGQTANNQLDAVSGKLSEPLNFSGLGPAPQANEQMRQTVRDSMMSRVQPDLDQRRTAMDTQLANQGITAGSTAYDNAYRPILNAENDAFSNADIQAGNQMSQMYGLESAARDKAINEQVMQRQIPLNELAAMLSGSQVQGPQFVNSPQQSVAPPDIMGATYGSYNADMNNYNQAGGQNNAMTGGLFSLGSAAMPFLLSSDRRLKTNISRLGHMANGLGVYAWTYIWGGPEWVGVMADEVRKVIPGAVHRIGEYDAVDYRMVLEA